MEVKSEAFAPLHCFPFHEFCPGNGFLSVVLVSSLLLCITFCSTLHISLTMKWNDQPSGLCGTEGVPTMQPFVLKTGMSWLPYCEPTLSNPPPASEVSDRINRMCFALMLRSSLPHSTKLWCLKGRYDKTLILIICLLPHKEQTWRADTSASHIAQHTVHGQYLHWTSDKSNNPKIFQSKSSIHSYNEQQMN